jgi:hypothetical protein
MSKELSFFWYPAMHLEAFKELLPLFQLSALSFCEKDLVKFIPLGHIFLQELLLTSPSNLFIQLLVW